MKWNSPPLCAAPWSTLWNPGVSLIFKGKFLILIFFSLLFWISLLCPFARNSFLAFLNVFPLFPRNFRGSAERANPRFFVFFFLFAFHQNARKKHQSVKSKRGREGDESYDTLRQFAKSWPLRGPVAMLFIIGDAFSDSIATFFVLASWGWGGVSHKYRGICCKTGYRTDMSV